MDNRFVIDEIYSSGSVGAALEKISPSEIEDEELQELWRQAIEACEKVSEHLVESLKA